MKIVGTVVDEREVYCDHAVDLYEARARVGTLLESISAHGFLTTMGEMPWYPPRKS